MNDLVVVLGLPLFSLTAPAFVFAGALAIFGYDRAEARARRAGDERWLLVSLVAAVVLALAVDLRPVDGFRGVGWLVLRGVVAVAAVGLGELALLGLARLRTEKGATQRAPGTIFCTSRWLDRSDLRNPVGSGYASRSQARSRPRPPRVYSRGSATTTARVARPAP